MSELPSLNFKTVDAWAKPALADFEDKLVEELQHIATFLISDRHYRVLTPLNSLARVGFMAAEDFKQL